MIFFPSSNLGANFEKKRAGGRKPETTKTTIGTKAASVLDHVSATVDSCLGIAVETSINSMTEPLPEAVKLLNQRFLAEGCIPAERAQEIWETDLVEHDKGDVSTLKKALSLSNRQLTAVGLEIRGVIVDNVAYFAIVNKQPDEIAKMGFHSVFSLTEINYIRLILEKLSEAPVTKANLLNLKNSLKGTDSLTMDQAVAVVDRLVSDHWIWPAPEENGGSQNRRRQSIKTQMTLAPRTYMELSYMLVDQFGVENEQLPQQIHF